MKGNHMASESSSATELAQIVKQMFNHVQIAQAGVYEGGASLAQIRHLRDVARRSDATRIAEIGFNIGYSTIAFLESSPDAQVVSFELDLRPCVKLAKEFIDGRYPGRHELVIGDSATTVPAYADASREAVNEFDLIFIDGAHEYEAALADVRNSRGLAAPGAVVVMDDLTPWYLWGAGPTQAWHDSIAAGIVKPLEYLVDGEVVEKIEGPADRAWVVGQFI
jgi:predicted O-methyltransferase YrrM